MSWGVSNRLKKILGFSEDMSWGFGKGGNSPESSNASAEDQKMSGLDRIDSKPMYEPKGYPDSSETYKQRDEWAAANQPKQGGASESSTFTNPRGKEVKPGAAGPDTYYKQSNQNATDR
jgi:hypothetical protein